MPCIRAWLQPCRWRQSIRGFGTDFLTLPPRVDQAEAHAVYQGMASAVPLEAVNSGLRYGFPDAPTARRPGRGSCRVSGHGFSRAVGGSQFGALAPAAFLLARYVKQYGNSSGV